MDSVNTNTKMADNKKNSGRIDFEQAFTQLETLVASMEQEDIPLEDALKKFEQGIQLTQQCQKALSKAEQKVQVLIEKNNLMKLEDL